MNLLEPMDISYTVKKSLRSKTMRLSVKNGKCVVSVPKYIPTLLIRSQIETFIHSKSEWIKRRIEETKKESFSSQEYKRDKELLLTYINQRLTYFNQFYNFNFKSIKVKRMTSRWGSCSKKGNLNFNFKLSTLTEKQTDYVIVHELCHLKEFNHGINFWNLVSKTIPDYKTIRRSIKMCE
jgi:predicted metal-dependent hydrolase